MPPADVDLAALVEEGRAKLAAMTPGEWTVFGLDDVPRGIVDLMLLAQVGGPNALNEAWVANMGPDCTPVINPEQAPVDVPNAIGIVFLKNNAPTILSAAARTAQAEAESVRLMERERHFADALGVADGGQYRADWDAAICRVVAESTSLRTEVASLREQVTDLSRANDEAVADQLAFAKRVTETAAEIARLREALTPSLDTKLSYIGEVKCGVRRLDDAPHSVPWTSVKEIMAMIRERAALAPTPPPEATASTETT